VHFHYAKPPAPLFRRRIHGQLNSLLIWVSFHPDKLPRKVWWAIWNDHTDDASIISQRPARLRERNVVYEYLENVGNTVPGFYWEW
jgi:hypothetical protein